jgi:hypothetical protein
LTYFSTRRGSEVLPATAVNVEGDSYRGHGQGLLVVGSAKHRDIRGEMTSVAFVPYRRIADILDSILWRG